MMSKDGGWLRKAGRADSTARKSECALIENWEKFTWTWYDVHTVECAVTRIELGTMCSAHYFSGRMCTW